MVQRDKERAGAARFPEDWLVEPNRPGRLDGVFPDTPEKQRDEEAGEPCFPAPN